MSSSRSKRKRTDGDGSTSLPSRRRSRADRAPAAADGTSTPLVDRQQQAEEAGVAPPSSTSRKTDAASTNASPKGQDGMPSSESAVVQKKPEPKSGPPAENGETKKSANEDKSTNAPQNQRNLKALVELRSKQQTASAEEKEPTEPRASRIKGLIKHRRVLLTRVKQCGDAAKRRLETEVDTGGVSALSERGQGSSLDEITKWREMAASVAVVAKKPKPEEIPAEKRTSLSLRRGSSVGKKMNAALSSLAPSSIVTSSSAPPPKPTAPQHSNLKAPPPPPHPSLSIPAPPTAPASFPSSTPLSRPTSAAGAAPPVFASKSMQPPPIKSATVAPVRQDLAQRKFPSKSLRVTSSSHVNRNPTISKATTPTASTVGPTSGRRPVQRVHFPEAISLRLQRDRLRGKLSSLMENGKGASKATPESRADGKKRSSSKADAWRIPETPKELPGRRKTHWDYVLEEMRWLATDFIEERKWKHATSRTISSAVRSKTQGALLATASVPIETTTPATSGTADKEAKTIDSGTSTSASDQQSTDALPRDGVEKLYPPLSLQDSKVCRQVAKSISDVVESLAESVSKCENANENSRRETAALSSAKSATERTEMSYEEITAHVRAMEEPSSGRSRRKADKSENVTLKNGDDLSLYDEQQEGIEYIEELWGRPVSAGGVLTGLPSSGKTVATCALLWRQRTKGPQLVVCPSAYVARWTLELRRLSGLRTLIVGDDGAFGPTGDKVSAENFVGGDILVVSYISLSRAVDYLQKRAGEMYSVVFDCRFPSAFIADMAQHTGQHSIASSSLSFPPQLKDADWWNSFFACIEGKGIKRVMMEYPGSDSSGFQLSALTHHEQLLVASMRAAFVLGPHSFWSASTKLHKRVVSWARRYGDKSIQDKVQRVMKTLRDSTIRFQFVLEGLWSTPNVGGNAASVSRWSVRRCSLPASQRRAYDQFCVQVRGILSAPLSGKSDRDVHAVAKALSDFRWMCLHEVGVSLSSFLQELVLSENGRAAERQRRGPRLFDSAPSTASPSQPNYHVATAILGGSAKLRELVSILSNECGYEITGRDCLDGLDLSLEKPRQKGKVKSQKKVAVLATLPQAQLLVSLLLSVIGVRHRLLMKNQVMRACGEFSENLSLPQASSGVTLFEESLEWEECTQSLASFNSASLDANPEIVVGSPFVMAGQYGNLGIDEADVVISVDENWSGNTEAVLRYIALRRSTRVGHLSAKSIGLVRLVADQTIESALLSVGKDIEFHRYVCPIDMACRLHLPEEHEAAALLQRKGKEPTLGMFSFPLKNFHAVLGLDLRDVFESVAELPPLFSDGRSPSFLPPAIEDSIAGTVLLARKLLSIEASHEQCPPEGLWARVSPLRSSFFSNAISIQKLTQRVFEIQSPTSSMFSTSAAARAVSIRETSSDRGANLIEDASQNTESDFSNRVGRGGLNSRPDDQALQILLYSKSSDRSDQDDHSHRKRENLYSKLFSRAVLGGSEASFSNGSELVSYFPPLFPNMINCAWQSRIDAEMFFQAHVAQRTPSSTVAIAPMDAPPVKRMYPDTEAGRSAKRPRIPSPAQSNGEGGGSPVLVSASETDGLATVVENSLENVDPDSPFSVFDEDFGLLGNGAFAIPEDAAARAGATCVRRSNVNNFDRGLFGLPPCDSDELSREELSSGMDSLVVVVSRAANSTANRETHIRSKTLSPLHSGPGPNGATGSLTYKSVGKAPSTVSGQASMVSSAFSRLPQNNGRTENMPATNPAAVASKESFPERVHATFTSRQAGTGLSMFESTGYKVAVLRIQKRLSDRLADFCWRSGLGYEVGPGLRIAATGKPGPPRVEAHKWTMIPKRQTGPASDETTRQQSKSLSEALRRSHSSPRRVDFGPFTAGFLSLPSGMVSVFPRRVRMGISLPMGVKLPHLGYEIPAAPWTKEEDALLQTIVLRFGFNWPLVSKLMSNRGLPALAASSSQPESPIRRSCRSARMCRERWRQLRRDNDALVTRADQALGRFHPDCPPTNSSDSAGKSAHTQEPRKDRDKLDTSKSSDASVVTMDSPLDNVDSGADAVGGQEAEREKNGSVPTQSTKRSFALVMLANSRRRSIPMSIPGVAAGAGPSPSLVPSHPSHMQSVQASVAAQWTNGRTEMWPLQILEVADKQRAASAAQRSKVVSAPSSAPKRSMSSGPSSRSSGSSNRAMAPAPTRTSASFAPPLNSAKASSTSPRPKGKGEKAQPVSKKPAKTELPMASTPKKTQLSSAASTKDSTGTAQ